MIKKLIKKIISYVIKYDILLVYILSRTPFFAVWLLSLIFGLFGGEESNLVNFYCLCIIPYINGTALLLLIIFNTKKTRTWVTHLVGTTFLEKFVPNKGFSNFLILILPNLVFVVIEIVSMKYNMSYKFEECERLFQVALDFQALGDDVSAQETLEKQLRIFKSIPGTPGLMSKLAKHSYMSDLRDLLCRIFGL
nr:hypothetical protein [Trebouxia sp. A1-2]